MLPLEPPTDAAGITSGATSVETESPGSSLALLSGSGMRSLSLMRSQCSLPWPLHCGEGGVTGKIHLCLPIDCYRIGHLLRTISGCLETGLEERRYVDLASCSKPIIGSLQNGGQEKPTAK